MGYLRYRDYAKAINDTLYKQIVGNDDSLRLLQELTEIEEIKSYLIQKYWFGSEFTDTFPYNNTQVYEAGQRAEINFPLYSATSAYEIGALVIGPTQAINPLNNQLQLQGFICNTSIGSGGEAFNPAHWTLLGFQYDIFNLIYPKPIFNLQGIYKVGDQVFWKNNTYTCLMPTVIQGHDSELQQGRNSDYMNGIMNIFPDDPVNGATNWGTPTPYNIAAGTNPSSTMYWKVGDNRCQQLISAAVFMVLYKLSVGRLAPANVNEHIINNYKSSIALLELAANGTITINLPIIQVTQGRMVRFGSNVKNKNNY